jgi:HAD superfamily hydrolase (TIGR01493 family)
LKEFWPKGILLDFFGTVVEDIKDPAEEIYDRILASSQTEFSMATMLSYWSRIFSRLCNNSYGAEFKLQKDIEIQSLQETLDYFKIHLDARMFGQRLSDYRAHPVLFAESKTILSQCQVPISLVTNIDNAAIQAAVQSCGLHFDYIVTSEDCKTYKPRREIFEKALSLLRISPDEALHIGDSYKYDVEGAKALGIRVMWVDRLKRVSSGTEVKPDYIAANLTGLLDILADK